MSGKKSHHIGGMVATLALLGPVLAPLPVKLPDPKMTAKENPDGTFTLSKKAVNRDVVTFLAALETVTPTLPPSPPERPTRQTVRAAVRKREKEQRAAARRAARQPRPVYYAGG